MALTLLPVSALAGESSGGLTVETITMNYWANGECDTTQTWIFANGKPITIEAKGTGSIIKDASGNALVPDGFTNDAANGYDLSAVGICGGAHGDLEGNTFVTMTGGTVGSIVGGCYGGTLTENASVDISGGIIKSMPYGITDTMNHPGLWDAYNFSVVGGSFAGNENIYSAPASAAVSGSVNLTISGGQLYGIQSVVGQGAKYSNSSVTCKAWADKAFLTVTGGTFSPAGTVFIYERNLTDAYYGSDYGETSNGLFAKITGSDIKIETNAVNSEMETTKDIWFRLSNTYLLTDSQNKSNYDSDTFSTAHYIMENAETKNYTITDGAQLFCEYTIPAGYKLEIPAGVTLTIPAGATITNNGSIVIKGTLVNNGTISVGGSIVSVGGTYTPGTDASPASVQSAVEDLSDLTFEAGVTRGTTKISGIDAAGSGNTQYSKLYADEPVAPSADSAPITDLTGYGYTQVVLGAEIPAAENSYLAVYELDSSGKIKKYHCEQLIKSVVGGDTAYDALEPTILSGGDGDNTTKITATAADGDTLYYGITDSAVGTNYAYNTPIDVSGPGLTAVSSGADIPATLGKYLSVYEVDSTTKLLRKFLRVSITLSCFTAYTGGLVADTANKIIYCNGKTVCMSVDPDYEGGVSKPKLYVLESGVWKQALPKNLPFSEGFGFSDYTLSGKSGVGDTPDAEGTLYILSSEMHCDNVLYFFKALPKGAENFKNFIIPDLFHKDSLDKWTRHYTVGGTIDPSASRLVHLDGYVDMDTLNLEANAAFIVPTENSQPANSLKIHFHGGFDSITKGAGATIQNEANMLFQPQVDIKMLRADGSEFLKSESGVYQIPNNVPVTIVAALSANGTAAHINTLPAVCTADPQLKENIDVHGSGLPEFGTYAFAFEKASANLLTDFKYFADDALTISTSGSGLSMVTTAALTLPSLKDYQGMQFFVSNQGVTDGGSASIPPRYIDNQAPQNYAVLKGEQEAITASMPTSTTCGTTGLTVGASGGSSTGAFSYESSDTGVATVDASGNLTIVGEGSTEISVTKAGDDNYEPVTKKITLTVTKKVPTAAELSYTPAEDLVYSGSAKPATVSVKDGVTGLGGVTAIYYEGKDGTTYAKSTEAPTNAGTYQVSVDLDAGVNYASASGMVMGEFTIAKCISFSAPTNGSSDDAANAFTFTPVEGYADYQFSIDGGTTWANCVDTDSSSDTITINVGNIAGVVKVRIKETENYAGAALTSESFTASLEGSVTISGTVRYGQTLTANVTGAQKNAVFHYVWKAGGAQIADATENTLTLTADVLGKTITVEVSAPPYEGTLTSAETAAVGKATPSGTPSHTAISASGKTLADAALSIGSLKPDTAGYTLKWVDDKGVELTSTTEVKANTAYKWMFTPKDTAIYDILSGTIVLYSVSTGGDGGGGTSSGGGSGSSGGSSNIVTVPVSDNAGTVSVTASVSGGTATITATDAQLQKIASSTETGAVKIDVSGTKADAVIIPAKVAAAVDNASNSAGLEVALPTGTVTLDKPALAAVADKGDVKLSVETVSSSKLSDSQKATLGSQAETAFVVDVNLYVNNTRTSTFGDGKITVSVPYTLKAGENANSITVWFLKDDGTIEPKTASYADGKVTFTTEHLSQYLIVNFPFADVAESAWCYSSVAYAYDNGLFSGTSATTFSPNATANRQMIWMVLARMDGKTPANMAEAKAWAVENGISDGSDPTGTITRQQMAAILYRYAQHKGYDTTQGGMAIREFSDYDSISAYAQSALGWAVNTGLVQGKNNQVMPWGNATRAQVATILQRFSQNVAK